MNPGGMGDARFASTVHLHDEAKHIDQDHEISMNEPLVHGKYTFYQSGILPSGTGTVLTVACDPGLFLKYLGSIMTCAGTVIMFVTRSNLAKVLPFLSSQTTTQTKEQFMRRAIAASLAFVCLAGSAFGASSADAAVRLECLAIAARPGRRPAEAAGQPRLGNLAVAGQSRQLHRSADESIARRHGLLHGHAARFAHLGQNAPLALRQRRPRATAVDAPCRHLLRRRCGRAAATSGTPCPCWWSIRSELRKLLGMAADQKYIAPRDLQQAKIESPRVAEADDVHALGADNSSSSRRTSSRRWKRKAWNSSIACGPTRTIAPAGGWRSCPCPALRKTNGFPWIPCCASKMDDETDPSGSVRELRDTFHELRAAYLANSPAEFNAASHKFLALVREMGPQLGAYPSRRMIDLEVAYNHWAPFRFAWVLMLAACLCVLLQIGVRLEGCSIPLGLASYVAGMVAMLIGFFLRVTISGLRRSPTCTNRWSMSAWAWRRSA